MIECRSWLETWEAVDRCDALIVDAPYSAKTQNGHDAAVCDDMRRAIVYPPWTAKDVAHFVSIWHMKTNGWMVSITDDILAPIWRTEYEKLGRYAFAPLPFVAPGSRVRLAGDGPSCWTTWIVVSRPRRDPFATWGTLPGAYVLPRGQGGAMPVVGGKPLWLMQRLVEDYSREGDLVCDPCCGAGTTLVAALRAGRRAIGGDIDPKHAAIAADWTRNPTLPAPGTRAAVSAAQPSLL